MPTLKTKKFRLMDLKRQNDGSYTVGLQVESETTEGLYAGQPIAYVTLSASEYDAYKSANGGVAPAMNDIFQAPFALVADV